MNINKCCLKFSGKNYITHVLNLTRLMDPVHNLVLLFSLWFIMMHELKKKKNLQTVVTLCYFKSYLIVLPEKNLRFAELLLDQAAWLEESETLDHERAYSELSQPVMPNDVSNVDVVKSSRFVFTNLLAKEVIDSSVDIWDG